MPNLGLSGVDSQDGTFASALKLPIHRWYPYPVGFAPGVVQTAIREQSLKKGARLLDPFAGTGTSLLVARSCGLESYGLESHPFIYFVGSTKLRRAEPDLERLTEATVREVTARTREPSLLDVSGLPALLRNCYEELQLAQLLTIRDCCRELHSTESLVRDLCELAIAAVARPAASVSTKWPYVAPKRRRTQPRTSAVDLFERQLRLMVQDLLDVPTEKTADALMIRSDARLPYAAIEKQSIDIIVTSAPYLNNFDYADRTRLETYLLGHYTSWRDITENVRRHLVVSATTQVTVRTHQPENMLSDIVDRDCTIGRALIALVGRITAARMEVGGNKRLDLMAAAYFRDMFSALIEMRKVVKSGGRAFIVLGDSALFGVHVATDEIIGNLALLAGYRSYHVQYLRARGAKWTSMRRSPHVSLRESLVSLSV